MFRSIEKGYYNTGRFIFCCVFALFVFVLCTLCCQVFWIVNWWLPLRYSLTFIHIHIFKYRFYLHMKSYTSLPFQLKFWCLNISPYWLLAEWSVTSRPLNKISDTKNIMGMKKNTIIVSTMHFKKIYVSSSYKYQLQCK